jgi:signal recognition particle subunit SRP54
MFETLTEKLELTFKRLRGQGKITEKNIEEALRDVRMALLEADVHFQVVKAFLESVKTKSLGQEVFLSLTPDQQFIKVVKEELTRLLGEEHQGLEFGGAPPWTLMLAGLQGSGKTTTLAKLALHIRKEKKKKPYMVSADIYRPAAMEQLRLLGRQLDIPVHPSTPDLPPLTIVRQALEESRKRFYDVLLIDTAGRLHIDEELMQEIGAIEEAIHPNHLLLVVDAMTGQDAVNQARGFSERLEVSGIVLTKMDGDARGGAALSMRHIVGKPILFCGTGEKTDALELFHPDRMASRILGMGDVLSLIEKPEKAYSEKETERIQRVGQKGQFSLEDFQEQLKQLKTMGPLGNLLEMIPGGRKLAPNLDVGQAEKEFKRVEAIINSMTIEERRNPAILNGSRRRRIAQGSGTTVTDVNRLMKQFLEMKKMMRKMTHLAGRKAFRGMPNPFH